MTERDEILQLGAQAQAFVSQAFFKRWLDHAEKFANEKLTELKNTRPEVDQRVKDLRLLEWQIAERVLAKMQQFPYACIEAASIVEKERQQESNAIPSISA